MHRHLDLAMILVGRPRLIFLDEPTAGLDPRSRRAVWQLVRFRTMAISRASVLQDDSR